MALPFPRTNTDPRASSTGDTVAEAVVDGGAVAALVTVAERFRLPMKPRIPVEGRDDEARVSIIMGVVYDDKDDGEGKVKKKEARGLNCYGSSRASLIAFAANPPERCS